MRIAILGATSEIAKDLLCAWRSPSADTFVLFARRVQEVQQWIKVNGKSAIARVASYDVLMTSGAFDAVINFVGVGDPAMAQALGASIMETTQIYDDLALRYVKQNPGCRYIFLSSGAVYGADFEAPANEKTPALLPINNLTSQDWYTVAKLYAECRHRAMAEMAITDVRVFSYFSHTQNTSASYLMADVVRAICSGTTMKTSSINIVRDYLNAVDFYQLIYIILQSPPMNIAVDCYSLAPADKFSILDVMRNRFGLKYEIINDERNFDAARVKTNYYSRNRAAQRFGYRPSLSSLDCIVQESEILFHEGIRR